MHYRNGREARIGDYVVGKGYNLKDAISGIVTGLTPGVDSCNIRVLVLRLVKPETTFNRNVVILNETGAVEEPGVRFAAAEIEYGATSEFLHVDDALALK